jgi:UDP-N-acetylmuramoylalanine--D-glutamate ligase
LTSLVIGLGVTGSAMARALVAHREEVVATEDRPTAAARATATELGIDLVEAPPLDELVRLLARVDEVLPSPGVPDHHLVFVAARDAGVPIRSEFDLAARWDDRPMIAITGTNGKTTVTMLVRDMLEASGRSAAAVGNTEVPLVAALDDHSTEVFVVEASSFRLAHSEHFSPEVGTWLNFAADHLDGHRSLLDYELAKARVWTEQGSGQIAIGNVEDAVVARHLASAPAHHIGFGLHRGDYHLSDAQLVGPEGDVLAEVDELWRSFPHDLSNDLAAAASALAGGATLDGVRSALVAFRGLPHRVTPVGEAGGVRWYDDSKATAPHATIAALQAFESVVLIAGGRNKGLDLGVLADEAARLRGVVAIGEAAPELVAAFAGKRPVATAASMDEAVAAAASMARSGDAVLLSPACASFDWYRSYSERGDDFIRAVEALLAESVGASR